jgi:hypothetical protein
VEAIDSETVEPTTRNERFGSIGSGSWVLEVGLRIILQGSLAHETITRLRLAIFFTTCFHALSAYLEKDSQTISIQVGISHHLLGL